jgi:CDP-2,3-bis-(O-geranylgeranyl)-sn-glycerol synthase
VFVDRRGVEPEFALRGRKAAKSDYESCADVTIAMQLAELVYVMLPAYLANMAAPFAKFWSGWNRPINRRSLGDHKTVVGFAFGVAAAVITSYVQSRIPWAPRGFHPSDWLALGLAQGTGAMCGDTVKSYFKRRIGLAPGRPWIPADQLDFIVGALAFSWWWLALRPLDVAVILGFTFVADIIVNRISFRLGIKQTKW